MTSAERRALKDMERERDKIRGLLVAVLLQQGGSVRIPRTILESVDASSISTRMDGDEFVIWLGILENEPARPAGGFLGRLLGV